MPTDINYDAGPVGNNFAHVCWLVLLNTMPARARESWIMETMLPNADVNGIPRALREEMWKRMIHIMRDAAEYVAQQTRFDILQGDYGVAEAIIGASEFWGLSFAVGGDGNRR